MAYTAWSVVYGEQPTAAKWNQLGTNDAGFKDGTNIDNWCQSNRHMSNTVAKHEIDWTDVEVVQAINHLKSVSIGIKNLRTDWKRAICRK